MPCLLSSNGVHRPTTVRQLALGFGPIAVDGSGDICLSTLIALMGPAPRPSCTGWLNDHLPIAASIVWEDSAGAHGWAFWNWRQKAELDQAFNLAWDRTPIPVADVPPNQAFLADDDQPTTILAPADAWAYFKASVAQSLAIEIGGLWGPRATRRKSWSILAYHPDQLAQLFDSREMFRWNASPAGYRIIDTVHGRLVPAPPARSYAFLSKADLIGGTRLDTLGRLLTWCRANLFHYYGSATAANMEDNWQYRGDPPLRRMMDGTIQTSQPGFGVGHATAGCWGTVGFLRALLRAINIPVKLVISGEHAQPWFMADNRYLSHGDDPYDGFVYATPPFPAADIMIDQQQFDNWFGAGVSDEAKHNNVGRGPKELAIFSLPNHLLHAYCDDLEFGGARRDGIVFGFFIMYYTVAQLEALDLWTRMDSKIASLGGCASRSTRSPAAW
jgi:hypothetical protein